MLTSSLGCVRDESGKEANTGGRLSFLPSRTSQPLLVLELGPGLPGTRAFSQPLG